MRVDQSPTGFSANANASTGGTDVFICYKKEVLYAEALRQRRASVRKNSLRRFWENDSQPHSGAGEIETGCPPTSPSKRGSISEFNYTSMPYIPSKLSPNKAKTTELRRESLVGILVDNVADELSKELEIVTEHCGDVSEDNLSDSDLHDIDADEYQERRNEGMEAADRLDRSVTPQQCQYFFPIIMACSIRHGKSATVAIQGLENCLGAGVFDEDIVNSSNECRTLLDVAIVGVCNTAFQGVYEKFPTIKSFLTKVINKSTEGLRPHTLHRIIEVLIYMEECSPRSGRNDLRRLVTTIMSRLEDGDSEGPLSRAESFSSRQLRQNHFSKSCESMLHGLVSEVINDVVDGIELAKSTEHVVSCCRVSMLFQVLPFVNISIGARHHIFPEFLA